MFTMTMSPNNRRAFADESESPSPLKAMRDAEAKQQRLKAALGRKGSNEMLSPTSRLPRMVKQRLPDIA
jgi:hypothetical protein